MRRIVFYYFGIAIFELMLISNSVAGEITIQKEYENKLSNQVFLIKGSDFGSSKGKVELIIHNISSFETEIITAHILTWNNNDITISIFQSQFLLNEKPIIFKVFNSNNQQIGSANFPYKDVSPNDWFADYVVKLWKRGIFGNEFPMNIFSPNKKVTRAEFIKYAVLAYESDCMDCAVFNTPTNDSPPYSDINENNEFYYYIKFAWQYGWLDKSKVDFFHPNETVNRAEVAKIIYMALNLRNPNDNIYYKDVNKADWFWSAVTALTDIGILNGYNDGYFKPNEDITYAQLSKIIYLSFSSRPCVRYVNADPDKWSDKDIQTVSRFIPESYLRDNSNIQESISRLNQLSSAFIKNATETSIEVASDAEIASIKTIITNLRHGASWAQATQRADNIFRMQLSKKAISASTGQSILKGFILDMALRAAFPNSVELPIGYQLTVSGGGIIATQLLKRIFTNSLIGITFVVGGTVAFLSTVEPLGCDACDTLSIMKLGPTIAYGYFQSPIKIQMALDNRDKAAFDREIEYNYNILSLENNSQHITDEQLQGMFDLLEQFDIYGRYFLSCLNTGQLCDKL